MSNTIFSRYIINNEYIILKIVTFCIINNINDMLRLSFTNKALFNIINNNKQYILNSRLNYKIECKDYAYIPKYLKNYDKYLLTLIKKDVNIVKYIPKKFRNNNFLNNIVKLYGNKIIINNNFNLKIINNYIIGQKYDNNNNLIFEGEFYNNNFNGRCKKYNNNNLIFDGRYKNNYKNGLGTEYDNNGIISFYGEYKNNLKNGKGIEYENGNIIYDGYYKNNLKNGKGIVKYNNLYYNCEFKNGNLIYSKLI